MLRLRPAWLDVDVGPQGVTVRWPGGERAVSERAIDPDGTGLTAALEDALRTDDAPARLPRRARVTLDDGFCWIDVAEGDLAELSADQLALLARGCASEVLGSSLDRQQLRWQVQPDGRHVVLIAVPDVLLDGVRQAIEARGMTVAAMQCAFARRWNAVRCQAPAREGVLAVVKDGHAILVRVDRGMPTALSREYVAHSVVELEGAARRLLTRHGDPFGPDTPRVLVSDDPWRADKLAGWSLLNLESQGARA